MNTKSVLAPSHCCLVYCESLRSSSSILAHISVRHVMYLLNPLRTPTAVLFTISDATSPIPLHTAFTCLHLCLQSYLCLTIFHPPTEGKARVFFSSMWPNAQNLSGYVPVANPHLFPLLISSIAPMLCAILHKGWANFTWWCFCGVLFLIHLFVQKGRLRDQTRIEGLERLKCHAKGA